MVDHSRLGAVYRSHRWCVRLHAAPASQIVMAFGCDRDRRPCRRGRRCPVNVQTRRTTDERGSRAARVASVGDEGGTGPDRRCDEIAWHVRLVVGIPVPHRAARSARPLHQSPRDRHLRPKASDARGRCRSLLHARASAEIRRPGTSSVIRNPAHTRGPRGEFILRGVLRACVASAARAGRCWRADARRNPRRCVRASNRRPFDRSGLPGIAPAGNVAPLAAPPSIRDLGRHERSPANPG